MATTANTSDPKAAGNDKPNTAISTDDQSEATEASSLPEAIECTAIKQFYSPEGALVEVGQAYVWTASKNGGAFPWPVLMPNDPALHKACEKDYKSFKRDKMEKTGRTAERNLLLARLAEVGVD